jgi:hypothetical protein
MFRLALALLAFGTAGFMDSLPLKILAIVVTVVIFLPRGKPASEPKPLEPSPFVVFYPSRADELIQEFKKGRNGPAKPNRKKSG